MNRCSIHAKSRVLGVWLASGNLPLYADRHWRRVCRVFGLDVKIVINQREKNKKQFKVRSVERICQMSIMDLKIGRNFSSQITRTVLSYSMYFRHVIDSGNGLQIAVRSWYCHSRGLKYGTPKHRCRAWDKTVAWNKYWWTYRVLSVFPSSSDACQILQKEPYNPS